jgi:hypothetical protein
LGSTTKNAQFDLYVSEKNNLLKGNISPFFLDRKTIQEGGLWQLLLLDK